MSARASELPCGPPSSLLAVLWNGVTQPPLAGSGTQTVGDPPAIGMPSTPGYVPKYVSKERFSCMIMTTCLMRWMSPGAVGISVIPLSVGQPTGGHVTDSVPEGVKVDVW